ncbi:hypothetical protein Tco_0680486 [Tanacetum coccineum]|uniref:Reverse transcriptase Ty1/copia-type domain-containing protein n=1 Tax=Tanacetum coccineum TaxID=301880 RepID=A0ABQ4XM90_9ASTR
MKGKAQHVVLGVSCTKDFSEEVAVLKREVACKDYEINVLKSKFEKVKQEKEGIELKIEKFNNASKSLDKLLGSQITKKNKKGLGYNVVPPPHPLIYNRPKKLDLSYSGLDEFKDPEFKSYGSKDSTSVCINALGIGDLVLLVLQTLICLDKDNLVKRLPSKHLFVNDQKPVLLVLKGSKTELLLFKNKVMDNFCKEKGIKREYSVSRNSSAQKIGVLVVKPHNKTPYELFRRLKPALSFMRPFGCHVTILNTLDNLGKFDGKSDEDKPMIEGNGPKWLFDIDSLTQSMNYAPVVASTISNESAGTQGELNAGLKICHPDKVYKVGQGTLWVDRSRVMVYVDDIIFGSTNKELCTAFEKLMKDKFQMSSVGELTFFLGLQSASTPVDLEKPLVKDGDTDDVDVHLYRSMIGYLMYLTASRPDIMFAYSRDSPFELVAYTDSDYAGATQDRKSTTGGCQFLGNRLISWQCKKQTVVATSTTEAEYVAAASCYGQAKHNEYMMLKTSPLKHVKRGRDTKTPQSSGPPVKVGDEAVHKELGGRMERAATTASLLEAEQDSGSGPRCQDTILGSVDAQNFLNASHIKYALIENLKIYISLIHQFWGIATARTTNDGEVEIIASIDGQVKTITEVSLRRHLKLEDSDGITSLPNTEIFEQLALMGYVSDSTRLTFQKGHFSPQWRFFIHTILHCLSPNTTAWEQFSSNIATAIICLATNRTFNFSKMIFDAMVKNLDSTHKFLMYPIFLQICLNKQKRLLQPHTRTYPTPTLTQKLFSNMKRVSKGYSEVGFPLFSTMITTPKSSPSSITSSPSLSPQTYQSPLKDITRQDAEIPQCQFSTQPQVAGGSIAVIASNT